MLHSGEQWPYLPSSRRLWSPKPIHSCPVLALDAIRNALLHCLDERAALCRQVLAASSSRAVVRGRRAGASALPAVWLGRVGPLDRALEILWRIVRGSHRGRLLAGFIEEGKNRGASQTSSETLLPFDIGLISGSCVALIQPPGHNAALEHSQPNGRQVGLRSPQTRDETRSVACVHCQRISKPECHFDRVLYTILS